MNDLERVIKKIIKIIDIIGYLSAIQQFYMNNYSWGTVLTLFSMLLSITLFVLEHYSSIQSFLILNNPFSSINDATNYLFKRFCKMYISTCFIIYALGFFTNETAFGFFNLLGLPIIFMLSMLYIKIIDKSSKSNFIQLYDYVLPIPHITFAILGIFTFKSLGGILISLLAAIIIYVPILLLSNIFKRIMEKI